MPHAQSIPALFPEIESIENKLLAQKVVEVWEKAIEINGWEDITKIPFTLLIEDLERDLVKHTRTVTRQAMAIAEVRDDLDHDTVVAGGLLHDIGKLFEYTIEEDRVVKSPDGYLLRHPVSGAAFALEIGLPREIAHIIASHSKEGNFVSRTKEAILIHHCDFIDFEIEKTEH